jgi:NTP pyrophosphatase (non-canonical NTP hydrolase)
MQTVSVDFKEEFLIPFNGIDDLKEKTKLLEDSLSSQTKYIVECLGLNDKSNVIVDGNVVSYKNLSKVSEKLLVKNCANNITFEMIEIGLIRPQPEIFKLIEQWGKDKGIIDNGNILAQFGKLLEEVNELYIGLIKNDKEEVKDAIGDCVVVLTLLSRLAGMDLLECVHSAYEEIKNRKGKMINGTFVKNV